MMMMMVIKLKLIQKILLKKLHNKFINLDEFNEEYNKFKDSVEKLEKFKNKKTKGSIFQKQKKNNKI